ncbi:SGNH/GDSL hydrolase family protein [Paenibacillus sp. UNC451MF]|uniref:SGNH/GDSL hydrolase family protein n=1 Tax=Paenibacillus sp. UNC451MF TaxID=1449063 RepID=UPI000491BD4D|nr:SGNH/GDSL hydrolase family protein [Paenibacillus sp. UNC451MF]
MEYQGIRFHNVVELEQKELLPGLRLQRFPKHVRHSLSENGRTKAVQSNGCELRFVTEAKHVRVTLASLETNGRVLVFRGDFFHSSHNLQAGVPHTIHLEIPERFADVEPDRLHNGAFSSKVWRIFCERFNAVFYDVDAFGHEVRPPSKEEVPRLTFVAYGSSITQGAGALSHYNGYIQQAARRLEVDALNLGLSGSCHCEKEVADHIAEREDWDLAFLEIGVNMMSSVPVEEFSRRATYLLDTIIGKHPDKPIFLTTIYPNRASYFKDQSHTASENFKKYNQFLREYALAKNRSQLHLLEGSDIMTDFTMLTSDLTHPSDYGHIAMGERLAEKMRFAVEQLRETKQHEEASL